MHVVTISATYGAAGSVVGPAVAERLGVPFLDRAIPTAVANDLGISLEEAMSRDEQVPGWLTRLLAATAPLSTEWMIGTGPPPTALLPDERILTCTKNAIRRCISGRGGVILGRAGAIVLRDHPGALHVRLDGDPERRVRQAMSLLGTTEAEARAAMSRNDNARTAYVRRFYHADPASPDHYHLVLDSTRIPPPLCTEIIVTAVESRHRRTAAPTRWHELHPR
jgi:cytidylate kinase